MKYVSGIWNVPFRSKERNVAMISISLISQQFIWPLTARSEPKAVNCLGGIGHRVSDKYVKAKTWLETFATKAARGAKDRSVKWLIRPLAGTTKPIRMKLCAHEGRIRHRSSQIGILTPLSGSRRRRNPGRLCATMAPAATRPRGRMNKGAGMEMLIQSTERTVSRQSAPTVTPAPPALCPPP